jgi:hypothetical protein
VTRRYFWLGILLARYGNNPGILSMMYLSVQSVGGIATQKMLDECAKELNNMSYDIATFTNDLKTGIFSGDLDKVRALQEENKAYKSQMKEKDKALEEERKALEEERKAAARALKEERKAAASALKEERKAAAKALEEERKAAAKALEEERKAAARALEEATAKALETANKAMELLAKFQGATT